MAKTKKQQKMKELEAELRSLIDENNAIEVEKVDRYLNLVGIFYELDKSIKKEGVSQVYERYVSKYKRSKRRLVSLGW